MASIVRPERRPRGGGLVVFAVPWLVWTLFAASPADASHPAGTLAPGAADIGASPARPPVAQSVPPATPVATALVCLAMLVLAGILNTRQWRRVAMLGPVALLLWFSAEAAFHSAHHVAHAGEAERCPVFSAAQHTSGVDPEVPLAVVERPAPTAALTLPAAPAIARVDLAGIQTRAPPAPPRSSSLPR